MDLGIAKKVILVTGAGSGIGRVTAQTLTAEGAHVALVDLKPEGLKETLSLIESKGGKAKTFTLDVTDHKACVATVAAVVKELGPLYGVCNVAGVLVGKPFVENGPETWEAELNVCLKGTMNVAHAAIPELAKLEYGKIVNVASDAGRVGEKSMVSYSAAKGGVIAFTKSLAKLLGRSRTNVNCVCPATTKTPMIGYLPAEEEAKWQKLYPLRRLGDPQDIADAIAFLASQRSNWITGQALSINGGYSMA